MKTILKPGALGTFLSLLLLCSCATQNPIRLSLPPETSFNATAGRGDWVSGTDMGAMRGHFFGAKNALTTQGGAAYSASISKQHKREHKPL
jgi:hypothetical protein